MEIFELLLLFFRLKSIWILRLWCFTRHATNSFKINIMAGFIYLLLAYLHIISLLTFLLLYPRLAVQLPPSIKRLRN